MDEPPRKTHQPPSSPSPSVFSWLPYDIELAIIARVPKRHYRILSCVSKHFRELVRSPDIHRIRSLLSLDSHYICLIDGIKTYWFALCRRDNDPTPNLLISSSPVPTIPRSANCVYTCFIDGKIYALSRYKGMSCCDIRDGSWERFEMPDYDWRKTGVCAIENVLYVYFAKFGLMWFDTEMKSWRMVDGLSHMEKVRSVGMMEYYGNLVNLFEDTCNI